MKNWKIENWDPVLNREFFYFQFFVNFFRYHNWKLDQGFSNVIQFFSNFFEASKKLKKLSKIQIPILKTGSQKSKNIYFFTKKIDLKLKKSTKMWIGLLKTGSQKSPKNQFGGFSSRVPNININQEIET